MKNLSKPDFNVMEVFSACISTVDDFILKQELIDCLNIVTEAEKDFDDKFPRNEIYQIERVSKLNEKIGKDEMKIVYDYRMVRPNMPGHIYYDKLKSSAPYGKCPLCSIREVDTLDHYLPKSKYPVYAVTPLNLVPSCFKCNQKKKIDYPKTEIDQTLHPYYDNIEASSWLKAKRVHNNPISFEYYVEPPERWSKTLTERVLNHFYSFNLKELFSAHANEEFRGIESQLITLYNNHPDALKHHLRESYNSRLSLGVNSWQSVLYYTLVSDEWFCSGGLKT